MNALAVAGVGLGLALGAVAVREASAFSGGKIWVSQGGSPHGSLYAEWLGKRSVVKRGIGHFLRHPFLTLTAKDAELATRKLENRMFYGGDRQYGKAMLLGYDNGPDAFRHTFGSALIVYRVMRKHHADARTAAELLHDVANAHERDSWLHLYSPEHAVYSSEMDVHNNILGEKIGAALAHMHDQQGLTEEQGEAALRDAVLGAIAAGKAVVMDTIRSRPRPARLTDIATVDGSGRVRLLNRPPSASEGAPDGFPMPLQRDGQGGATVDLRLPHVSVTPRTIGAPREQVPQR